jgi:hypothetical protein
MITRLLVSSIFGFLSCAVFASDGVDDGLYAVNKVDLIVADNRRKDRRDDRQDNRDDKQDCRQEEGRVGDDKRECKQENRSEGDEEEAESDA